MPNIFNLYKDIMNIDIGIIVIFTCKNSCNKNRRLFVEEFAYIQRTGEKVPDFDKNTKNENSSNKTNEEIIKDLNKISIKNNTNNEPDEDGFIEVKKKKR